MNIEILNQLEPLSTVTFKHEAYAQEIRTKAVENMKLFYVQIIMTKDSKTDPVIFKAWQTVAKKIATEDDPQFYIGHVKKFYNFLDDMESIVRLSGVLEGMDPMTKARVLSLVDLRFPKRRKSQRAKYIRTPTRRELARQKLKLSNQ